MSVVGINNSFHEFAVSRRKNALISVNKVGQERICLFVMKRDAEGQKSHVFSHVEHKHNTNTTIL
jgi:hypothetical protein